MIEAAIFTSPKTAVFLNVWIAASLFTQVSGDRSAQNQGLAFESLRPLSKVEGLATTA